MSSLTAQLLLAAFALGAVQLINAYSYENCVADQDRTTFKCVRQKTKEVRGIIKDLPKSIHNLTISLNNLQVIPNCSFANFSKLQNLSLVHNNFSFIHERAFENLHQLKFLDLSSNLLSELNSLVFQSLHNLTFLSLEFNKLKELPQDIFSGVPALETFLIRKNYLTNFSEIVMSVSHLKNLSKLDLCSNNLTSLANSNVSLPKSLTELYLCRNNLRTLGCERSFLKFVKVLDVSHNFHLQTQDFQGVDLTNVKYLHLNSTGVEVVKFVNMSNINVRSIDFSGTGLKNDNILKELCTILKRKLKYMGKFLLTYNGIESLIDSLDLCPKIRGALDLSNNELKKVECLNFLKTQLYITKFVIEHNHLTLIPSCEWHNRYFLSLKKLSYRYNRILSVNGYAFHHTPNIVDLNLNINNIAFLNRTALKGLKKLEILRLDNNLLTDLFDDTFKDNVNLQTLNLRNNRISVIFNNVFSNLKNLTILDLGGNKITLIHNLTGLISLSKLYLDGNNLKTIDSSYYNVFQNTLTVLDLDNNMIRFNTKDIRPPFLNLSKLSDLKLSGQRPYGLSELPHTLFRGLRSLKSLYLSNNKIYYLAPETFDDLTGLKFLTLENCCVGLAQLQPGVFKNLRNLTRLVVKNMGIQNCSKEVFGNLTSLQTLQLNYNVMQRIPVDTLDSLPKLSYLDIRSIPLSCTCKNRPLQNYTMNNPNIQVVFLRNLPCPENRTNKFYKFDTRVCYIDLGHYMFFCTAAAIFLFTLIPLLYDKLYWKLKYGYYVFRSWFSDYWSRLREQEENCKYDAFISYNSSDEEWVMKYLLPNLEGSESSFRLCLHHRDFELGRDIVDNIVNAVYSSKKTICIVSKNFLQSEWCSLEIQLASYRLFDEHRDVLLLVFLEPISDRQLSSYHRMRKVMLKKTYLQWPSSNCTDLLHAQELFWSQLRRAIKTGSRLETQEDCPDPDSKKPKVHKTPTSDETYYLEP